MCVCMFPDSPDLTFEGLRHIGNFTTLVHLQLQRIDPFIRSGQGSQNPWELSYSLRWLYVSGELQVHTHAVDISTA